MQFLAGVRAGVAVVLVVALAALATASAVAIRDMRALASSNGRVAQAASTSRDAGSITDAIAGARAIEAESMVLGVPTDARQQLDELSHGTSGSNADAAPGGATGALDRLRGVAPSSSAGDVRGLRGDWQDLGVGVRATLAHIHDHQGAAATASRARTAVIAGRARAAAERIEGAAGHAVADARATSRHRRDTAVRHVVTIALVGAFLALLVALLVIVKLVRRTARVASAAVALSKGNLEEQQRAGGRDEIGMASGALAAVRRNLREDLDTLRMLPDAVDGVEIELPADREQEEFVGVLGAAAASLHERGAAARASLAVEAARVDGLLDALDRRTAEALALAGGDLEAVMDVDSTDAGEGGPAEPAPDQALGRALASLAVRLRAVFGDVTGAAGTVRESSEQLRAMTHDVGQGMEDIAASVGALAAGAEQQVRELEQQREQAAAAATTIEQTRELSATGLDAVLRASEAMGSLEASSLTITEAIDRLAEKTASIEDFVAAVVRIADQTNLLALNAAIEAARAGDAGRGFAVVADEVRKLADETQQATGTISQLVQQIRVETTSTVKVIEQTNVATTAGVAVVDQARAAFETITESVEASRELVAGIAAAADTVTDVAMRSSESTANVSAATQEASASMEEMAAAAADLSVTADELLDATARFQVGERPTARQQPSVDLPSALRGRIPGARTER